MLAMIINNDCGDVDRILSGIKTEETRSKNVFKSHIGERFAIITRKNKKQYVVAYCTVGDPITYNCAADFDTGYYRHRVSSTSNYYIKDKKYGYPLLDLTAVEPYQVFTRGCNSVKRI